MSAELPPWPEAVFALSPDGNPDDLGSLIAALEAGLAWRSEMPDDDEAVSQAGRVLSRLRQHIADAIGRRDAELAAFRAEVARLTAERDHYLEALQWYAAAEAWEVDADGGRESVGSA